MSKNACTLVVDIAHQLVAGTIPFLEGVRQLASLRFDVSDLDHDPDFTIFVAIASQADHLPPAQARPLCTPDWLQRCDEKARELESFYSSDVRAACQQLVARYTPSSM